MWTACQSESNAPQLSVKKCFQRSFVMQKGASAARGDDDSAAYRRLQLWKKQRQPDSDIPDASAVFVCVCVTLQVIALPQSIL